MVRHATGAALLVVAATGCSSASIYKPDVIGPHGEHLVEISCSAPDACMDFARQLCGGDFDVVTSGQYVGGAEGNVYSKNLVLIKCQNAPGATTSPGSASKDAG